MRVIAIVLGLFLTTSMACTQDQLSSDFDKDKMDSLFSIIEKNEKAMGSVSIFHNGEEVYQNSLGYADVKKNLIANQGTIYRIGSISKTYTTSIISQLIDENKLSLDTKLQNYFPEIPNASEITIEQMLRHRSGLYNFTNAADLLSWMEQPKSKTELIQIFVDNGTVFSPDEKAEYSNTNFVLLSYIAEEIDGKSFSTILEDRITTPLKLKKTYYGDKINTAKNEALSYKKGESWELDTESDMSIPVGAGAIVSTPTDINAFYYRLFKGDVVSDKSLIQMRKMVDNFGMGLFQMPFYDKKGFGHTGGIDGFRSMVAYFPNDDVSVALTANSMQMNMNDILIGALSIYYGKDYELPEFKPTLEIDSDELDIYAGTYSSADFPLKVTIFKQDDVLMGQATGQPAFALEAYEINNFKFDQAGLKLEFLPEENKMILKQGGGVYELTKE